MPDTAKRLAGPAAVGTVAATVYTTPAATTTVLRNIHVANTTTGALTFNLSVGADAAGTRLYSGFSVPANGSLDWSGFIPLAATEVLQALASAAGLTLTVSGVEVS